MADMMDSRQQAHMSFTVCVIACDDTMASALCALIVVSFKYLGLESYPFLRLVEPPEFTTLYQVLYLFCCHGSK